MFSKGLANIHFRTGQCLEKCSFLGHIANKFQRPVGPTTIVHLNIKGFEGHDTKLWLLSALPWWYNLFFADVVLLYSKDFQSDLNLETFQANPTPKYCSN